MLELPTVRVAGLVHESVEMATRASDRSKIASERADAAIKRGVQRRPLIHALNNALSATAAADVVAEELVRRGVGPDRPPRLRVVDIDDQAGELLVRLSWRDPVVAVDPGDGPDVRADGASPADAAPSLIDHRRWRQLTEAITRAIPMGVVIAEAGAGASLIVNEQVGLITRQPGASWSSLDDYADLGGRSPAGRVYAARDWPLVRALTDGAYVLDEPITIERADGTSAALLVSALPVRDGHGRVVAAIQTMVDVSGRQVADVAREAFLAVLSHEIKTPLTAILGDSEVLLASSERLPQAIRSELLRDIAAEAERLRIVVDNLMVLARAETGDETRPGEPTRIGPLLERSVRRARAAVDAPSIDLAIAPALPPVMAVESSVEHVLANLLRNAATHGGGPATVDARREGDEVAIRVVDEGPGLPDGTPEALFRLFATSPTGAAPEGAGIGLFVAARLVAGMAGRIWARDLDGRGAEFGFSVPVALESGAWTPASA